MSTTPVGHGGTETRRKGSELAAGRDAMTPEMASLTERIIGCAIEVHRQLGPGLLESAYERAMCIELGAAGIPFQCELFVPALYKGQPVGDYRVDLLVADAVVVEIKSVTRHEPVFEAQVLTYLRVTGKRVGLLINFNSRYVKDGIRRYVL